MCIFLVCENDIFCFDVITVFLYFIIFTSKLWKKKRKRY